MKTDFKNFGEWLQYWREGKNLSQQSIADRAGVSKSYISNIERQQPHATSGATPSPKLDVVDAIARALERPIPEARHWAGYGITEDGSSEKIQIVYPERIESNVTFHAPAIITTEVRPNERTLLEAFRKLHEPEQIEGLQFILDLYRKQIKKTPDEVTTEQEDGSSMEMIKEPTWPQRS